MRLRHRRNQPNLEQRKETARNLITGWSRRPNLRDKTLEILLTVEGRGKDMLQRLVEKYAEPGRYINNAGIISFYTDLDFAGDLVSAWADGSNSLAHSYRGTLSDLRAVDLSGIMAAVPYDGHVFENRAEDRWNLEMIGALAAQKKTRGEGITVAVVDSGADFNHHEIKSRFGRKKGVNFVDPSEEPMDRAKHGTHVSGIVAGDTAGVAPGAILYAVKVLNDRGSGNEADVIAGIDWCISNNVDIANMSLGGPMPTIAFQEILYAAALKGMHVVAAAGNERRGESYPAAYDNVISVGSVNFMKMHSGFSNISLTVDISAPGEDIYSSIPGGDYARFSGTSMAAPHVAGGLALVLSRIKNSNDYEALIKSRSERPANYSKVEYGAGILRLDQVLLSRRQREAYHHERIFGHRRKKETERKGIMRYW